MKGYVTLAVIVSVILLSFPPLLLADNGQQSGDAADETLSITVKHSDEDLSSDISLKDLTVYETAAQISWDAPIEAIKAQALACMTLFQYQMLSGGVVENTCLSYPSAYNEEYWKTTLGDSFEKAMATYHEAVQAVFGKQIVCDGQPIMALSHLMNSGVTENGAVLIGQELSYLQSVASPADATATDQLQSLSFTLADGKERLTKLLGKAPTGDAASWFTECRKTVAGTVEELVVCSQSLKGKQIKETFGLPSSAFDVTVQGEQIVFTVHGNGHFIGLSTYGAIAMAKDGHSFEDILCHYYTGVTIV